jgi:hypothetical protein
VEYAPPFSKFGGALKEIHSTDMGVIVIRESRKLAGRINEIQILQT